jgi:hypothetical protein
MVLESDIVFEHDVLRRGVVLLCGRKTSTVQSKGKKQNTDKKQAPNTSPSVTS